MYKCMEIVGLTLQLCVWRRSRGSGSDIPKLFRWFHTTVGKGERRVRLFDGVGLKCVSITDNVPDTNTGNRGNNSVVSHLDPVFTTPLNEGSV